MVKPSEKSWQECAADYFSPFREADNDTRKKILDLLFDIQPEDKENCKEKKEKEEQT